MRKWVGGNEEEPYLLVVREQTQKRMEKIKFMDTDGKWKFLFHDVLLSTHF